MKTNRILLALPCIIVLFASCAGPVDRAEDRHDRREDRWDRRVDTGPGDRQEDYVDRAENVNDKFRGRYGY